jgi:hypothetical protein
MATKRAQRLARVTDITPALIEVWPASADLRLHLRHPSAGGFRPTGSVAWPGDRFTLNRIKDGGVVLEDPDA